MTTEDQLQGWIEHLVLLLVNLNSKLSIRPRLAREHYSLKFLFSFHLHPYLAGFWCQNVRIYIMDYYYNFQNQIRYKKCFIWSSKHIKNTEEITRPNPWHFCFRMFDNFNESRASCEYACLRRNPIKSRRFTCSLLNKTNFLYNMGDKVKVFLCYWPMRHWALTHPHGCQISKNAICKGAY